MSFCPDVIGAGRAIRNLPLIVLSDNLMQLLRRTSFRRLTSTFVRRRRGTTVVVLYGGRYGDRLSCISRDPDASSHLRTGHDTMIFPTV